MRISIFGSGYVGLVQAAVFCEVRHQVTCIDIDAARIERIQGQVIPTPEFEDIKKRLITPVIIDGRNLYAPAGMEAARIEYFGIGRGRSVTRT